MLVLLSPHHFLFFESIPFSPVLLSSLLAYISQLVIHLPDYWGAGVLSVSRDAFLVVFAWMPKWYKFDHVTPLSSPLVGFSISPFLVAVCPASHPSLQAGPFPTFSPHGPSLAQRFQPYSIPSSLSSMQHFLWAFVHVILTHWKHVCTEPGPVVRHWRT